MCFFNISFILTSSFISTPNCITSPYVFPLNQWQTAVTCCLVLGSLAVRARGSLLFQQPPSQTGSMFLGVRESLFFLKKKKVVLFILFLAAKLHFLTMLSSPWESFSSLSQLQQVSDVIGVGSWVQDFPGDGSVFVCLFKLSCGYCGSEHLSWIYALPPRGLRLCFPEKSCIKVSCFSSEK